MEAEKIDSYEDITETGYYLEDYEETGIYGRPLYRETDMDTNEDYEEVFGEYIRLQRQETAFVRGHAAYRKVAEAEYELDIWETDSVDEIITEEQSKKQRA